MNKSKKNTIIILAICLLVLVIGLIVDNIMGKNYFIELEYDEVIEKFDNDEDFILLLSQTTCSHCQQYKPKLEDVANEYKLEVYYIEVDLLSKDESDNLKKYASYSSTPSTVFVHNGEEKTAASRINGDASTDKIIKKLKSNGFID